MYLTNNDDLAVSFSATYEGTVSFTVGGTYNWSKNPKRVSITKWLLREFKKLTAIAVKEGKTLSCSPFSKDGKGDMRKDVYEKVGFKSYPWSGNIMLLFPSKEKEDEVLALQFFNSREVTEEFECSSLTPFSIRERQLPEVTYSYSYSSVEEDYEECEDYEEEEEAYSAPPEEEEEINTEIITVLTVIENQPQRGYMTAVMISA